MAKIKSRKSNSVWFFRDTQFHEISVPLTLMDIKLNSHHKSWPFFFFWVEVYAFWWNLTAQSFFFFSSCTEALLCPLLWALCSYIYSANLMIALAGNLIFLLVCLCLKLLVEGVGGLDEGTKLWSFLFNSLVFLGSCAVYPIDVVGITSIDCPCWRHI